MTPSILYQDILWQTGVRDRKLQKNFQSDLGSIGARL